MRIEEVNMEGPWIGKLTYKIKPGYEIPRQKVQTDLENVSKLRGNIDDDPCRSIPWSWISGE